jgi:hypothetical protein
MDTMLLFADRWWRFPGAEIDFDSVFEWRGDGELYLCDSVGNVVKGIEVKESEVLAVVPLPTP